MAIIQNINNFIKKKFYFSSNLKLNKLKILSVSPILLFSLIILFGIIFFTATNLNNQKNLENKSNLNEIRKSSEFLNFTDFLFSKIKSPYQEFKYTIKNNNPLTKNWIANKNNNNSNNKNNSIDKNEFFQLWQKICTTLQWEYIPSI